MRLMTHLDNGIGELDRSEELDALLLGGGSEAEGSIVTYSLVGKEEGGNVERAGLGDGFSNSGGRAHHEYYDMSGASRRIVRHGSPLEIGGDREENVYAVFSM